LTLGGWLAAGIAWHISMMWVLFADGLAYLAYGTISGHFWRDLRPSGPRAVLRDLWDALRFRLPHRLGHYNAVQRLLYTGAILCICVAVLTGLSIWKPVQLGWLTRLFGGYPLARHIHLAMMFCIVAFLAVHLALDFEQQPLTPEWGAPVRLRIPVKLGFKSAKNLESMAVTNTYPGGFWENQGYDWFSGV
jgi:thiosulfate reductase cytochrome b subunit